MKVIIAGSRNFNDYDRAKKVIADAISYNNVEEVISGGCYGSDALGERYAKEHGIPTKIFPADWDTYGRSAGPRRNRQMAEYAAPDGMLIAFWNGTSKGTKSMVEYARNNNLHVVIEKI